jgi:hypothetical protein
VLHMRQHSGYVHACLLFIACAHPQGNVRHVMVSQHLLCQLDSIGAVVLACQVGKALSRQSHKHGAIATANIEDAQALRPVAMQAPQ